MATNNKDFKIKNGLVVDGATATVGGNNVLTSASSVNDLSDVTVTDPTSGQVLKWNGTAWINDTDATGEGGAGNSFTTIDVPNGTDPVADSATDTLTFADGANITITGDSSTDTVTVAVDADLTAINAITLDTTPTSPSTDVGTLSWDVDNETANLKLDAHVDLQIGQEHLIRVKNSSGSVAIPKDTAVMFAGATGDTVTVTPAISTSAYEPLFLVGVTAEEILADGFGFVTQFGFINNVNTGGMTLGDLLYVDPATPGLLTVTKPAAPNWTFPIAAVTKVNASSGRILVRIIPGDHLHDIVDVAISSPADNEVLAYNSENGTWINQTASEAGLSVVGHTHLLADVTDVTASAVEVNILDGATLSTTELNYVDGVTSAIQTQIDGKAATGHTHTLSGITDVTASASELNILDGATLTTTELNYVDGVTSAIQTQLNGKAATSHTHVSTDVTDFTEAAQDAVGGSVGTGLSYNDSTGAVSVDTTAIQARVTNVSDTEIGYLDGVTSAIQTQINDKASLSGATFTGNISAPKFTGTIDGGSA